jgi:hypothetical protein
MLLEKEGVGHRLLTVSPAAAAFSWFTCICSIIVRVKGINYKLSCSMDVRGLIGPKFLYLPNIRALVRFGVSWGSWERLR